MYFFIFSDRCLMMSYSSDSTPTMWFTPIDSFFSSSATCASIMAVVVGTGKE